MNQLTAFRVSKTVTFKKWGTFSRILSDLGVKNPVRFKGKF